MEELKKTELNNASEQAPRETHNPDKEFAPKTKNRIFFILGVACCLAVLFAFYKFQNFGRFITQGDYEYYRELDENYGKYNEILRMIGEDPIATSQPGEIDDAKLKELVASIGDPYAEYFTAEEYKEFEKHYKGDYVGIGVGVLDEEGKVIIKNVVEGGPADEAGIKPEDVIISVDGTKPKDSTDAVNMITGESGVEVSLVIERNGEELEFKMNRTKIENESVTYSELTPGSGIGYIKITSFIDDTAKDFKLAVRDLKNMGCDKFIVDLRDNGGGLTEESIEIADYLLPACKIMTEVKKDGTETVHNSKASSADLNFVVLTNMNTASASEILAGALQDNDACLIIGEKTFGKGVTQITRRFRDGSAVKLTTTEYFRPSGETVNEIGITPDIEATDDKAIDVAVEELNK